MPLKRRLALVSGAAVAIAITLAAAVCYLVVRNQLRSQVDQALAGQAALVQREGSVALGGGDFPGLPPTAGGRAPYWQVVASGGGVVHSWGGLQLPVDSKINAVASGNVQSAFEDVTVSASHLRVYTFYDSVNEGNQRIPVAVQLARPLQSVDHVLTELRLVLVILCIGGVALAVALGRIAARRVLAPLAEVAQTAEHISETEDLSSRITVKNPEDEVGQLTTRFNAMLERLQSSRVALDESMQAQRQLVADASHELRTPVTSLRTNIEVLLEGGELEPGDRNKLLADVVEQTEELTGLVSDLIELARGDLSVSDTEEVRLDRVVEEALARARRNTPAINFQESISPATVNGVAERLDRAIGNLLDNAARHSSPGGIVQVTADADGVRVRDHGTGFEEADIPHVFDRFYRGINARSRQGSGLGLAIVRQTAEQHDGFVTAENAEDGGALLTLRLPGRPVAGASGQDGDAPIREREASAPVSGGPL